MSQHFGPFSIQCAFENDTSSILKRPDQDNFSFANCIELRLRTFTLNMSVWLPPVTPTLLEGDWLPTGYSDNTINVELVHTVENALDRRRKQIKDTAAPNPLGTFHHGKITNKTSTHDSPRTPRPIPQDDSDVGDEEGDDELASEEWSGDDNHGSMTSPADRTALLDNEEQAYDDEEEDEDEDMHTADEEDEDDDDDVNAYL